MGLIIDVSQDIRDKLADALAVTIQVAVLGCAISVQRGGAYGHVAVVQELQLRVTVESLRRAAIVGRSVEVAVDCFTDVCRVISERYWVRVSTTYKSRLKKRLLRNVTIGRCLSCFIFVSLF